MTGEMNSCCPGCGSRLACALALALLIGVPAGGVAAQSPSASPKPSRHEPVSTLEREFFAALRTGDSSKVVSYISAQGVDVGPDAHHQTREQIEQQFQAHRGLYCKLFDSSCIDAPIKLDNSARACSYRQLLTRSDKARTAASEVTRNGVQQAVLVARIQNSHCPNDKLIDFVFNLEADGWKLFSIP